MPDDKEKLQQDENEDGGKKLTPAQVFGAALGLSAAVHGAAIGAVGYYRATKENDRRTLAQAQSHFNYAVKSPHAEKSINAIPVESMSEEEFEAVVSAKIGKAQELDDALRDLTELYRRRQKAFHKAIFADLKNDGILDSSYADFLMKQAAYDRALEEFGARRLKIIKVTDMQKRFDEVKRIVQAALASKSDVDGPDIDAVNELNRALVRDGVLKDYDGSSALFDKLLMQGQGNCDGISTLSMAVYRALFGRQGYRYLSYADHFRTVFTASDGTKYRFENTDFPNRGEKLEEEDPNGVELPAESLIMSYLEKYGYDRTKFPPGLQAHWQKNVATAVTATGRSDSLWGNVPGGRCVDGSAVCHPDFNAHYSLAAKFKAEVEEKAKRIEEISLAEILDEDFFQTNPLETVWHFGDERHWAAPPPADDGLTVVFERIKWNANEQRVKAALEKKLVAEGIAGLTKTQLQKLDLYLKYAYALLPTELQKLRDEELPQALTKPDTENLIARIRQMRDPRRKLKWINFFIMTRLQLPDELADALPPESAQTGMNYEKYIEPYIQKITPYALRKLLEKRHGYFLNLRSLKELTPEHIEIIGASPNRGSEIYISSFSLQDAEMAHMIGQKWLNVTRGINVLKIGDITTPEAAAALTTYPFSTLTIAKGQNMTPLIAEKLGKGKILGLEFSEQQDPQILEALAHFRGHHFIYNADDLSLEEARALGKISVRDLYIVTPEIIDPEIINILKHAAAYKVGLVNVSDISDEAAAAVAEAGDKFDLGEFHERRIAAPEKSERDIVSLRIGQYLTPSAESIQAAEQATNNKEIEKFMKRFGRITPTMISKLINPDSRYFHNSLWLTSPDVETARHLRDANASFRPDATRSGPITNMTVLDMTPEFAQALFKGQENIGLLAITFGNTPSNETLQAIVEGNAKHNNTTILDFPSPLTKEQAEILGRNPSSRINIGCTSLSADAAKPLVHLDWLELTVEEPIDEATAGVLATAKKNVALNQTGLPDDGVAWLTPEAARVLARDFAGTNFFSNPATLQLIDSFR